MPKILRPVQLHVSLFGQLWLSHWERPWRSRFCTFLFPGIFENTATHGSVAKQAFLPTSLWILRKIACTRECLEKWQSLRLTNCRMKTELAARI